MSRFEKTTTSIDTGVMFHHVKPCLIHHVFPENWRVYVTEEDQMLCIVIGNEFTYTTPSFDFPYRENFKHGYWELTNPDDLESFFQELSEWSTTPCDDQDVYAF